MKYLTPMLLVLALSITGCALFGPSVEKAQQVAEQRQELLNKAFQDFEAAGHAVDDLVKRYNEAKAAGDTDAVQAIEAVLPEAISRYKSAEAAYKSAEDVFNAAVQDFKDAKSTSDYLGTVLGWLSAGLSAVVGGGFAVTKAKKAGVATEALGGVTAAVEGLKANNAAWSAEKADHIGSLSTAAKKLIDDVRP